MQILQAFFLELLARQFLCPFIDKVSVASLVVEPNGEISTEGDRALLTSSQPLHPTLPEA